jgi:predicted AAA+ superfamily ATPase
MVDLLLVRRLKPWASNGGERLVRSPKVYVRDSGLLHTLLGIQDQETLLGHPVIGSRWEGMIIENILDTVPTNTRAWFYRTSVGAEIDLVLETSPNQRWAIAIKRSISDPTPSKVFYIGCADVKANHQIVIYPGRESYKHDPKTEIMPLGALLKRLSQQATH